MPIKWSEAEFQDRIKRRCEQLASAPSALLKAKGYPEDLIRRPAKEGRRIDSIIKIANALDWTLAEALGIEAVSRIDVDLLARALAAVDQRLPKRIPGGRTPALIRAAALLYNVLARGKEEGKDIPEDLLQVADALLAGQGFLR